MRIKLQVDLLEAIRQAELPFIFKGGTSLLLLPETPRRLSTDIDINQPGRNGASLVPVRSDKPIPKEKIFDCMEMIRQQRVKTPIHTYDILVENICGTGSNIVATGTIE